MSLYEFRDTTESTATMSTAAEAVTYGGVCFDTTITGFRTLSVSGREAYSQEIEDYTVGNMPGSFFRGRKYPPRTITVRYQLLAASDSAFRTAFNSLNGYLNKEQQQLKFNDETDKYFIATSARAADVPEGVNSIISEIDFYCTDPRKYSINTKTVTAASVDGILQATIANTGNVKTPIDYEITMNSQNGYVGIASEYGAMQYGYPEEADTTPAERSEYLVDLKNGNYFLDSSLSGTTLSQSGTGGMEFINTGNVTFTATTIGGGTSGNWLTYSGSLTHNRNTWAGGCITTNFQDDSSQDDTAIEWHCKTDLIMETGAVNQTGLMCLSVTDENGDLMADIHLVKASSTTNNTTVYFRVAGVGDIYKFTIDNTSKGKAGRTTNPNGAYCAIQKNSEGRFFFNFAGVQKTVVAPAMANVKAKYASVWIAQAKGSTKPVTIMAYKDLVFRKDHVSYDYDVPNRYMTGDVLTINGRESKEYLNGDLRTEDEVLGTVYFKAPPGNTVVQFFNSSWATAVTAKATIREAWI